MFFVFKCLLQNLSVKNIVWLVIVVFTYVYLVVMLIQKLASLSDSMDNIIIALQLQLRGRSNSKYLLLWSHNRPGVMRENNNLKDLDPLHLTLQCPVSNCILTENKALFGGDLTQFDAVVFDESHFSKYWIPVPRASSQLYIFTTIESPYNHPACDLVFDDFFNWTFTYRLDSDLRWKYFVVRNISGDIVAPAENVQWSQSEPTVRREIKAFWKGRTKAVAWIVSNCDVDGRNQYLTKLQEHLLSYYLQIDIFGECTKRRCGISGCEKMLRDNYYFYLAFENSESEDYITEKVLHGYDNYVVPIVYGGANYSRFLPPGSYIDARKLHPYNLAHLINLAIKHPHVYESFFHWTNFYTINTNSSNPTCDLCMALNSNEAKNAPAKKKFRFWWNTMNGMHWCLSGDFWEQNNIINII